MLVSKVYTDFVAHTGLTSSIYKTVFIRIFDVLDKIKDIVWGSLKYVDQDGESIVFDFTNSPTISRYGIDLLRNIFINYYVIPEGSLTTLTLTYKNQEFQILQTSEGIEIPPEIQFLKDDFIFNMFILDKEVYDVFGAFDDAFEFIDLFRNNLKNVYKPLLKKFDSTVIGEEKEEGRLSKESVATEELSSEVLQEKMNDILSKIDEIRKERDNTMLKRASLASNLNSYDAYLMERDKLKIELESLTTTRNSYVEKQDKISDMLNDINAELADVNSREGDYSKDIEFLVGKKAIFEKNRDSILKSINDFETFITDLTSRIKTLDEKISGVTTHTTNDIETLDKKLETLNTNQDNLYGILLGLEAELKRTKQKAQNNAIRLEKSHEYSDFTIQNIENASIVDHLATPLQPSSVTTVVNYLRYYFAYFATIYSNELVGNSHFDTYIAQAIACKIVLVKYFGIYFNQLFSSVPIVDDRIGKVIKIVKD